MCPQCKSPTVYSEYHGFDNSHIACRKCNEQYKWRKWEKHRQACAYRSCKHCDSDYRVDSDHRDNCLPWLEHAVQKGKHKHAKLIDALHDNYVAKSAEYDAMLKRKQQQCNQRRLRMREELERLEKEHRQKSMSFGAKSNYIDVQFYREQSRLTYTIKRNQAVRVNVYSERGAHEGVLTWIIENGEIVMHLMLDDDAKTYYLSGEIVFLTDESILRREVAVKCDDKTPFYSGKYLLNNNAIEVTLLLSLFVK